MAVLTGNSQKKEVYEIFWMVRIIGIIRRLSSWRSYVIITSLFLLSFYAATGRPFGTRELAAFTGGLEVPDLSFGYTPLSVYSLIDTYGQTGRDFWLSSILPLDSVFSMCYLLFFAITLSSLLRYLYPYREELQGLVIIPVIGGISDIIENLCFVAVLLLYPVQYPQIVIFASVFTKLKFVSNISTMLLIIITLILAALETGKKLIARRNDTL
ncbi:MAG TPA: hypothetical protein VN429_04250 [Methanospirillum sp.]|uniref:hypothetical protein n=1 Tax=Methanospirillum sp. TaxID=45200 RepID=UPI002B987289|nr:hypothetical protein [Methanospirillum sp.]HWQ63606.1 hypothetical protein [Methanospirillum sp.]